MMEGLFSDSLNVFFFFFLEFKMILIQCIFCWLVFVLVCSVYQDLSELLRDDSQTVVNDVAKMKQVYIVDFNVVLPICLMIVCV
jgi:hypothetical protein